MTINPTPKEKTLQPLSLRSSMAGAATQRGMTQPAIATSAARSSRSGDAQYPTMADETDSLALAVTKRVISSRPVVGRQPLASDRRNTQL
jgi:hypothetical protein